MSSAAVVIGASRVKKPDSQQKKMISCTVLGYLGYVFCHYGDVYLNGGIACNFTSFSTGFQSSGRCKDNNEILYAMESFYGLEDFRLQRDLNEKYCYVQVAGISSIRVEARGYKSYFKRTI